MITITMDIRKSTVNGHEIDPDVQVLLGEAAEDLLRAGGTRLHFNSEQRELCVVENQEEMEAMSEGLGAMADILVSISFDIPDNLEDYDVLPATWLALECLRISIKGQIAQGN